LRFAGERRIVHAFPDQAPLLGFFSGKRLGQQCETARASRADEPRQNPRPARIRNEADTGKRLDEACRACRNDDVAGERDVRPGASRDAVDRGNHGKWQGAEFPHKWIVMLFQRIARYWLFPRLEQAIAEILPGAKAAAGACDEQRAAGAVRFCICNRLAQRRMHRVIECIEFVGPIQGNDAVAGALLDENGGFGFHGFSRNRSRSPTSCFCPSKSLAIRSYSRAAAESIACSGRSRPTKSAISSSSATHR